MSPELRHNKINIKHPHAELQVETEQYHSLPTFYATRLQTPRRISISQDRELLQQLLQGVEPLGDSASTWKFWVLTDYSPADEIEQETKRFFAHQGNKSEEVEAVATGAACYVLTEKLEGQTQLTLVTPNNESLYSLEALFANIYEPVERQRLDSLIRQNEDLPVSSAKFYDRQTGEHNVVVYQKAISFNDLSVRHNHEVVLLSIDIAADLEQPPLRVQSFGVNGMNTELVFDAESSVQFTSKTESQIMNSFFALTDMLYKG